MNPQKTLLLKHLPPANFEAVERAKLHSLTPVLDFIIQLQTEASRCNFGDQLQIQLRSRGDIKRRVTEFYKRREEISVTYDGVLCYNDRMIVNPTLRTAVLNDLHSGHLGIEKMKSLARLTCWWSELNHELNRVAKSCAECVH
ncbi:unnamed protein product [Echinostoma caproni]|uniref:Integrase_H2C2 domain-containing protein n=1 Tax=Echinostoma caproni TaxID=27848 RepID=A0A183AW72_9TREM|nr:unnamed protein product [Echinostoma caproni]